MLSPYYSAGSSTRTGSGSHPAELVSSASDYLQFYLRSKQGILPGKAASSVTERIAHEGQSYAGCKVSRALLCGA